MNTSPITKSSPRKSPAKRLFSGMAGSPLAQVVKPSPPVSAPKPAQVGPPSVTRIWDLVLLHYCFDQQVGEAKKEHCKCEERTERVPFDVAEQYVKDGLADWLIVKNARAKTGTSIFRRAIVMRSVVIDSERLFARPSEWKSKRLDRDEKHEAIKVTIRDKAKNLLRMMFSKGVIAQDMFQTLQDDAELDLLLTDRVKFEEFARMLVEQEQHFFHKRFVNLAVYWWNSVLGFHRLDVNAGTMMKDASAGTGEIVYRPNANKIVEAVRGNSTVNPAVFMGVDDFEDMLGPADKGDSDLSQEEKQKRHFLGMGSKQFISNNGRRVRTANHVIRDGDYGGADPHRFERPIGSPDEDAPDAVEDLIGYQLKDITEHERISEHMPGSSEG
jgi:hypothetical protein